MTRLLASRHAARRRVLSRAVAIGAKVLSVRTVQWHVGKVYITSRKDLRDALSSHAPESEFRHSTAGAITSRVDARAIKGRDRRLTHPHLLDNPRSTTPEEA